MNGSAVKDIDGPILKSKSLEKQKDLNNIREEPTDVTTVTATAQVQTGGVRFEPEEKATGSGGPSSNDSNRKTGKRRDVLDNWTLSCRKYEQEAIRDAYQRAKEQPDRKEGMDLEHHTEFVLISGGSGTGKTTLAETVRLDAQDDYGHFVSGHFDQLQKSEPYAAFVQAFSGFVTSTLTRGEQDIKIMRRAINKAVGQESKVLTDLMPEMKLILGPDDGRLEKINNGAEAINRFKFVMRSFLRAVASPSHPFVILLDNLHWADKASVDLLVALLKDVKIRGALFIVTYNPDYEEGSKLFDDMLSQIIETEINLTGIDVANLSAKTINGFLAKVLDRSVDETAALADELYPKSNGNLLRTREWLRLLQDKSMLWFDEDAGYWVWDMEEVRVELGNVDDILRERLVALPSAVKDMLKVASCLGKRLDEDLISHLLSGPIYTYFQEASEKGIIRSGHDRSYYEFSHDAFQDTAYNLIPEGERERFHRDIGRRLWKSFDLNELDKYIFVLIGQLEIANCADMSSRERRAIADLLLRAGERSVLASSFLSAHTYLLEGIDFLGPRCWDEDYALSLDLYNAAAEVAYINAQFDCVEMLVTEILKNAKNTKDTYRAQATRVYALGSKGRPAEALQIGLQVLKGLGISFPDNPTRKDVLGEMKKLKKLLKGNSSEWLLRLPDMEDPNKLAAMQLLNLIFIYAFHTKLELAPLIGFKMVKLTVDHGLNAVSCIGFVIYAICLCM